MNLLAKTFLVLLRLAIGWHFLVEGLDKIHSHKIGPTETSKPFTSAGYLREGPGPLGKVMRKQIGDLDEEALARLVVVPLSDNQDAAQVPAYTRFPPGLAKEWDEYFQRFAKHYQDVFEPLTSQDLTREESQLPEEKKQQLLKEKNELRKKEIERKNENRRALLDAKLKQHKDMVVTWLTADAKTKVKKTFPSGSVEVEQTTAERIEDYRIKLEDIRTRQTQKLPLFGRDVEREALRADKAELARMRTALLQELGPFTAAMKTGLEEALLGDWGTWPSRLLVLSTFPKPGLPVNLALAGLFRQPPEPRVERSIDRIDWITRWGLVVVGACLILGLFTRTASLAGAAFLLMLYLAMPPWPGLPEPLRSEGHYLFIDKNFVEMLALLALAMTYSGRWLGLDGLIQFLNPRRWQAATRREKWLST